MKKNDQRNAQLKITEKELFEALAKPHCSGITFSGGDPLHPFNREEVFRLIKKVRQELPKKTIVDMVLELKCGNKSVFSQTLKEKIMDTYNKKE